MPPLFCHKKLFGFGCTYGANAFTSAALDASFGIDNVTIVTLGDCANGAFAFTSTAADASITNYICHDKIPPFKKYNNIVTLKYKNASIIRPKILFPLFLPVFLPFRGAYSAGDA